MKKSKLTNEQDRPWIKYYKENVPANLEYHQGSMVSYLYQTVQKYPNNIAYEFFKTTCTYKEMYHKIEEVAKSLKAQGVKEGDRVSICMPNSPQAILTFYAVNMIGAVASMIHPLSAEKEIEFYINEAKSTFLLTLDLTYEKVHNILDKTNLKKVVIASISDELGPIKSFLMKFAFLGKIPKIQHTEDIMTWKEFLNYGYDYDGKYECPKSANDPAVILYSGGTTGDPKGILLSNLNFNALAYQCALTCDPASPGHSVLSILPIFHGFGLGVCIHTPLTWGMKCILIPSFKPKEFPDLIKKHKPNFVAAVPGLYNTLTKCSLGKKDLECIKCAVSGGDFMSSETKKSIDNLLKEHGSDAEVRIGYGLTESSAATCLTPSGFYKENSIGIPMPDTFFKIVKIGTHDKAEINADGELCISGPTVMMGYLNNLKETMQTLRVHEDEKVWLHTGDIASMDEEGVVYFKQRLKRVIISNGYNLYPSYIENVLNEHPKVLTSTVIGIDHPKKGQVAKAFIVLEKINESNSKIEKELREHCEKHLARYSLPEQYEFRESIPTTLVGKIAYSKLISEEKEKIQK